MKQIKMLDHVAPREYDIPGDTRWAEHIQYRKDDVLFMDEPYASDMVYNGDAEWVEEL